jgi:hypothetical protein
MKVIPFQCSSYIHVHFFENCFPVCFMHQSNMETANLDTL